jgi:hypothetical protein
MSRRALREIDAAGAPHPAHELGAHEVLGWRLGIERLVSAAPEQQPGEVADQLELRAALAEQALGGAEHLEAPRASSVVHSSTLPEYLCTTSDIREATTPVGTASSTIRRPFHQPRMAEWECVERVTQQMSRLSHDLPRNNRMSPSWISFRIPG